MTTSCIKKDDFDYAVLYNFSREEKYPVVDKGTTIRASYGYTLNSQQGYNDWYYIYAVDGSFSQMTYNAQEKCFEGKKATLKDEIMHSVPTESALRRFNVSVDGFVTIYGNYKCASQSEGGAEIVINLNDTLIYSGQLNKGDTVGKYFEINAQVVSGDEIYFEVKGQTSVSFNPVITYENAQNQSLYHLTSFGEYYGDVFPYYDFENKHLYMEFLWTRDARGGDYRNALELSNNMLTFVNIPEANNFAIWEKYKQDYRKEWIYNCNYFIDRTKYTFGIRDHRLLFDKENERYLLIAGCYYQFDSAVQTSDLVIYASDDPFALGWTKSAAVVEAGYSKNLPECPSLLKIGNRWYPFVSVAYNTAHQVGPLQYWVGDKGVDCLDVNWSEKDFYFLDGEDLCAARPVQVGNKVYLWGWIPRTYDTMPWSPWGGYLNLPREIIQLPNGRLGTRMDPYLSKLLNYGNIFTLEENNFTIKSGNAQFAQGRLKLTGASNYIGLGKNYNRNYITFDVDMQNSCEVGYIMRQGEKEYRIVIVKESGKTYLKILSPYDDKHTVNSFIEIEDSGKYSVKIVSDGEFVEFFVNDKHALTGHTAMTGESYESFLYSDGACVFENVNINKLIPYGELD